LRARAQLALSCFEELLDLAVADVASECHRIARLGLDRSVDAEEEELRAWAARAAADHPGAEDGGATRGTGGGGGNKGAPDVFGQTHPAIAADVVDCMNCGRPVVAGRFAPHLEKCMGKVQRAIYFQASAITTAVSNLKIACSPLLDLSISASICVASQVVVLGFFHKTAYAV
jgi:SAGA-associated factor 11